MKIKPFGYGYKKTIDLSEIKSKRRRSLPCQFNNAFLNGLNGLENTPWDIRRSKVVSNLNQIEKDSFYKSRCKIEYKLLPKLSNINAEKYVYCGMVTGFPNSHLGMSVSDDGDLTLIKGKSYNLIKGIYKKYTSGYIYHSAELTENQCGIKFSHIYVNGHGNLIGEDKYNGKAYSIEINPESFQDDIEGQYVSVSFQAYTKDEYDEPLFETSEDKFISFGHSGGKLWAKIIQPAAKKAYLSIRFIEVKLPLKQQYSISSIKRAVNTLQIEVTSKNKSRIYYLNPKNIYLKNFFSRNITHKPPQIFSSRLGSDPHEKYHAGQPFSSDRKGNFSSRYIPLLSFVTDNFRFHVKEANEKIAEERNARAVIDVAKGLDIGIGGIYSTASGMISNINLDKSCRNGEDKDASIDYNLNLLQSRAEKLSGVLSDALDNRKERGLSDALIAISQKIKAEDTIHLTSSNRISGFFGIATGGMPFCPGWSAGILGELSCSHSLSLSRTDKDDVEVTFTNKLRRGCTGIVGTGPGLIETLLECHGLNYMKVLPAEANLIIATHFTDKNSFTFSLSNNDFKLFVRQLDKDAVDLSLRKNIINESELTELKEEEFVIMLELKSELRLEAGGMANPNTFLVLPRTALGIRLALNLLKIKSTSQRRIDRENNIISSRKINAVLINPELDIFNETKIMPVLMHKEERLWCLPLPLIDEYKVIKPSRTDKSITLWDKEVVVTPSKPGSNIKPGSEKYIKQYYNKNYHINDVNNIPFFISQLNGRSIRKGLTLGQVARYENNIRLMMRKMNEIRGSLLQQERMSLNKSCVITLVAHYESIDINPEKNACGYRLKSLKIRRLGVLSHETATVTFAIVNFSSKSEILYNEFLGSISLLYRNDSDITSFSVDSRLNLLY